MFLKSPGFTVVAVAVLALGIGANTTIFSLVNAVLLRPLPVKDPDQLVLLLTKRPDSVNHNFSYPAYADYRDRNDVLSGLIAYSFTTASFSSGGSTERVAAELVSSNYFTTLGVSAALGRTFLSEEDKIPGTHPVAVVGDGLWKRHFGSDPKTLGKTVTVNGHAFTVIGVAPEGFRGADIAGSTEIWIPLMLQAQVLAGSDFVHSRTANWLYLLGRLKPGISMQQAQAAMAVLDSQLRKANPSPEPEEIVLVSGRQGDSILPVDLSLPLLLLMAAVQIVLLIACANVANLLLVRATARRKEVAVRLALGATRFRLVRQLLIEGSLLALLAGACGLIVAVWLRDFLVNFKLWTESIPATMDLSLDVRVLAFTLLLSILTGILFGLAPALNASRLDLVGALKDEISAIGRGASRLPLRKILVVAQVALSLVLLIGAGLLVRSLQKLLAVDPGFRPANVLLMSVDLEPSGYDKTRGRSFQQQVLEKLKSLPEVQSVTVASVPPVNRGGSRSSVYLDPRDPGTEVDFRVVGLRYFQTLGIPLLRGRDFTQQDREGTPELVIINETMARRFWPGQDPIGKRILWTRKGPYAEVIGVVRDGKYRNLREEAQPSFYLSLLQSYRPNMTIHARTVGNPLVVLGKLRAEVQALDKYLPVFDIRTLEDQIRMSLAQERTTTLLCSSFSLFALLLAGVGLYGVIAYSVTRQTKEIGIRMALGAEPRDVLKLVLKEGATLVTFGLTLGLAAAPALTNVLSSLLYGVRPTDPLTFVTVSLLLAAVAMLASYIPARRATKVDPMVALRYE
jgi:predicted permease